jgi:uncharacterized protein (DUF1501 family)
MDDPTTAQVLAELSAPERDDPRTLSRRRFLQASIVAAGTAALAPSWLGDRTASAVSPLAVDQGILVVVLLAGGNDGLNTVVPTGTGAYHDRRGAIAVPASRALPIAPGVGLHPNLTRLKARYDAGRVAVLQGVGDRPNPDLSHFEAMARWMAGTSGAPAGTGWLGRYLDGLGSDNPFTAVSIGSSVPLTVLGRSRRATGLPTALKDAFGASSDPVERRVVDCVRAFGAGSTGLGGWGDALAASGRGTTDLARSAEPLYTPPLATGRLAAQLDLCARVVNADLGVRVLHTLYGDFDSHADQPRMHDARMHELDAGIEAFFAGIDPRFADRVTLVTVSEFGRRVGVNSSNGTDHGTSSTLFAVGNRVRGGLHGTAPSLTSLDRHGNQVATTDFRAVYATLLDRWLGADSQEVLGARHADVGFLLPPGDQPAPPPSTTTTVPLVAPSTTTTTAVAPTTTSPSTTVPAAPAGRRGYLLVSRDGRVQGFGGRAARGEPGAGTPRVAAIAATPGGGGYWTVRADGKVAAFGDAVGRGSLPAAPAAPVVGMAATPSGAGYWLLGRDGRATAFGDAAGTAAPVGGAVAVAVAASPRGGAWVVQSDGSVRTVGSARALVRTGSRVLPRPVVGIAPTSSGDGYWLLTNDGAVHPVGDARDHGRAEAKRLNPATALVATATGAGYWIVAADGTVWTRGDAAPSGSATWGGRRRVAGAA